MSLRIEGVGTLADQNVAETFDAGASVGHGARHSNYRPLTVVLAGAFVLGWMGSVQAVPHSPAVSQVHVGSTAASSSDAGLLRLAQSEDPPADDGSGGEGEGGGVVVDLEAGQVFLPGIGWVSEAAFWDIYLNDPGQLTLSDTDFAEINKLTRPTD